MIWVTGTLLLLPINLIKFPYNLTLADGWILFALPFFWLYFVRGSQTISLSYVVAMWFILIGSFASTFAAPAPRNSLIIIVKESYAFVWFITLTAALATLKARDFRRLLVIWTGMIILHGVIIVAEFLSPNFWQFILHFSGKSSEFDIYRPSGLFTNPNPAAFFQLLGFVPLMLAGFSKRTTMVLGIFLLLSMLTTGSMGAAAAFVAGLTVVMAILLLSKQRFHILKIFAQLTVVILLLGGLIYFAVNHMPRYQQHLERILLGRAERSSEGRLDLWQRGLDAFEEQNVSLWGIGPENFRIVDGQNKQLHNEFLAFLVERGILGAVGLALFASLAIGRAAYMVFLAYQDPHGTRLAVIVFLAALIAALVESLTHQTFRFRELWLVLAFQEAMLFNMTTNSSDSV